METPRQKKLREDRQNLIYALKKFRSIDKVAKKLGKSRSSVKSAAYALKKYGHEFDFLEDNNDYNKEVYEPTPEQIAEACREIQSTWAKHDFQRNLRSDWKIKHVEFQSVDPIIHQKLSSSIGNE